MSTSPSTRGLITPALCWHLRNTQVLRPMSRPETGKSKQPSAPASQLRCLQQTGERHVLCPRSNLPHVRPWDAQEILTLILKSKPFFLKHVTLEHFNHNSTCKSNSKYHMFYELEVFQQSKASSFREGKATDCHCCPPNLLNTMPIRWLSSRMNHSTSALPLPHLN